MRYVQATPTSIVCCEMFVLSAVRGARVKYRKIQRDGLPPLNSELFHPYFISFVKSDRGQEKTGSADCSRSRPFTLRERRTLFI